MRNVDNSTSNKRQSPLDIKQEIVYCDIAIENSHGDQCCIHQDADAKNVFSITMDYGGCHTEAIGGQQEVLQALGCILFGVQKIEDLQ